MDESSECWTELRLDVPVPGHVSLSSDALDRHLEPLTSACFAVAPGGVVIEGSDAPPGDLPVPEPGWVRVRAYVQAAGREAAEVRLAVVIQDFPGGRVTTCALDDGWRDRWKDWFKGFDISSSVSVRPPWEPTRRSDGIEIVIEPGMAFGTGQHATTKLCLRWLDAAAQAHGLPSRMLDVGCGTGILSICASRLGCGWVDGLDVDEKAVDLARENAISNGVNDRMAFAGHPLEAVTARYPLVVANILAHILDALADDLVRCTAPGGTLLLSGMTVAQEAAVEARFVGLGMVTKARSAEGDWVLLEMERTR